MVFKIGFQAIGARVHSFRFVFFFIFRSFEFKMKCKVFNEYYLNFLWPWFGEGGRLIPLMNCHTFMFQLSSSIFFCSWKFLFRFFFPVIFLKFWAIRNGHGQQGWEWEIGMPFWVIRWRNLNFDQQNRTVYDRMELSNIRML